MGVSYWAAWSELDFAIKLYLGGFKSSFVRPTPSARTPDLLAQRDEVSLTIEVTSIDPQPARGILLGAWLTMRNVALERGCTSDGIFSRVPKRKELAEIESRVREASAEANEKGGQVIFNIPSLMTCFVSPWKLVYKLPERWRNGINMPATRRISLGERISRCIREKSDGQLKKARAGVVAIYDQQYFMDVQGRDREEVEWEKSLEIGDLLATYPNVIAAILVRPFNSVIELATKKEVQEDMAVLQHSLPRFEGESIQMWRNPLFSERSVFDSMLECLTEYPARLRTP